MDSLGRTRRADTWWTGSLAMAIAFIVFIIYATWAAVQNAHYTFENYTSPFYSPDFTKWIPGINWSPAFLIMWLPAAFRVTCYYGRKAYYRSLKLDPPGCAVGERNKSYTGERGFPLVMNNLHRYFLYLVVVLVVFHWIHLFEAYHYDGAVRMTLGSLVISADTIFLSLYVFSCHSLRHLVGGKLDCYSCMASGRARHGAWKRVSALNEYHNVFFWLSLFTVGFADLYIRMCSMGIWSDVRFF